MTMGSSPADSEEQLTPVLVSVPALPCVSAQQSGDAVPASVDTSAAATETMDLQQQVARLQALLEVSRQVHATTREDEVLETVLRIVVRELEMAGAAFSNSELSY